jgi:putative selenate reductase
VACGIVPITTCTDLLKTGGYGRLPPYLHDLQLQMKRVGARTVDDFILDYRGQREAANNDPVQAGYLNTSIVIAETQADPRYRAAQNRAVPKKIDSHLVTFDCITCDKCIPVCPNDANFSYHTGELRFTYRNVEIHPDGRVIPVGDDQVFALEKADQIANFADYCNHCGNCDTFCPEYDGPYLKKPNFYGSRRAFDAGVPHDGYLLENSDATLSLICRIQGRVYYLEQLPDGGGHRYNAGRLTVRVAENNVFTLDRDSAPPHAPHTLDVGRYHAVATLLRGIIDPTRIHAVNTPMLAHSEHAE